MKLGSQTGSLFNHMMSSSNTEPVVGSGATILHYTDRSSYFVDSVSIDKKTVIIERASAIRTDDYGMCDIQNYRYERNQNAIPETIRYRYGNWYKVYKNDNKTTYGRINIIFGVMREYHDYSF